MNRWCRFILSACLAGVVFLAGDTAANASTPESAPWPIFRGDPALHGISDAGVPNQPDVRWTFTAPASIKSSPVIAHGLVYIGDDDGHLHALDQATGKPKWQFKAEAGIEAPPTVHGDRVYVGSIDMNLYCLDARTGDVQWKYATEDKISGAANFVNLRDGRTLVLIGSHDTRLHAIDAVTGEQVWTYTTDNFINATVSVHGDRSVFGGCDGLIHVVNVNDGKPLRTVEVGAYVAGGAALDGDVAYLGHYGNEFIAVDVAAGKILWKYKHRNFPYFGSPALTDDVVVFGGRDKHVHCLDRTNGKLIWRVPTRARVDSSPVVADGSVVVGSLDGRLYVLDLEDGKEQWSYDLGESIISSPAVMDGLIVIAGENGSVYAFGPKKE